MKNNWTINQINDLNGKTVIVTGANSGIGFESAKVLASKGARVYFACRNEFWGNYAKNKVKLEFQHSDVHFLKLDLADLSSIHDFVDNFTSENSQLDILVNNAGIMMCPKMYTKDGFEMQIGTNHFGHFTLTNLLMGLISKTPKSRVVTVSSLYHRLGKINFEDINSGRKYHPVKAYQQSKLANLLFTFELDLKLKENNIDTISVASHPGWTATNLQKYKFSFKMLSPFIAQKPEMGALPTLFAATDNSIKGGDFIGPKILEIWGSPQKVDSSKKSKDKFTAKKLWELSETLTKIGRTNY
ncbi:MAG: SDR family NAD(P)-dependent oxidoreductase [Candidatus Marinimicrobia bacterium]|nr:SDR family NAD(P)-dependent oxidoreductase [Candidatus Neomarinimicrobiota bacterium]